MTIRCAVEEALQTYGTAKSMQIKKYVQENYPNINLNSVSLELYYGSNHNPRTGFRYERLGKGKYMSRKSPTSFCQRQTTLDDFV